MNLPILGNVLSVEFKEAGPAAAPLPPPPPLPDATVGLGVLSAGGRNGSSLPLARLIGYHRAQTCHFVARTCDHCVMSQAVRVYLLACALTRLSCWLVYASEHPKTVGYFFFHY